MENSVYVKDELLKSAFISASSMGSYT